MVCLVVMRWSGLLWSDDDIVNSCRLLKTVLLARTCEQGHYYNTLIMFKTLMSVSQRHIDHSKIFCQHY